MKRVSTSELIPGMVTAEDVYTYSGQMILPRGQVLTDKAITKLEFYSIINVRIEDSMAQGYDEVKAPDPNESPAERIRRSPEFIEFKSKFEAGLPKFQSMLEGTVKNDEPVNLESLYDFASDLLNMNDGYVNVFDMLHNMREYDDMTFAHSINVALICNVFARWLRLSEEETRLATLCGMLHDIGKVTIPEDIIRKPSKLSDAEFAVVKKHTLEGYNALKKCPISDSIMNSALMHHERCDGSGYPFGITNAKIDPFAKMVAIADVYDAMTSARIYRGPMCPFKVVEIFESEGLQKYDTRYIMTFLENIVNTYLLHRVRLNNGVIGEVVYINRACLSKPTIKSGSDFIDLSVRDDLYIEAII
ncbi:MAG: HD-GYP domain-containing protein [Lachnospiraceae bacterium]|nr:HD-GYP domain-containing protein [Lachnospiraceae bacterium]